MADVERLVLEVDSSVEAARAALAQFAGDVDKHTRNIDLDLARIDKASTRAGAAFAGIGQAMIAAANQTKPLGTALDQVTVQELRVARAVEAMARTMEQAASRTSVLTAEQMAAAKAVGGFAMATASFGRTAVHGVGSARSAQMEMMHVIRASADAYAVGIPVQQIFFAELGRVGQAAGSAGGALGALGKFLGGPWGLLVMAGVSVVGSLILSHKGAEKAAKDQKIEDMDLASALKKLDEATKGAITSERQHQIELLNSARAVNAKAVATRNATQAALKDALAFAEGRDRAAREQAPNLRGEAKADLLAAASIARETVASLQTRLKENEADIVAAEQRRAAALVPLMEQRARELTDPAEGARARAARQVDALRADFEKAGSFTDAAVNRFVGAIGRINQARDAEIKKIEEQRQAQRGASGVEHREAAAATDLAYMVSFLKREIPGVRITSATNHDKYVKGTDRVSDHYVSRAIDFVPPGGVHSMSKDEVRQIFESNGMRIRRNAQGVEQLFGPGDKGHSDHFHVAWQGAPPTGATLDRREESAVDRHRREQNAFADRMAQANGQLLAAQQAAARGAEDSVDVQIVRIQQERKALDEDDHRFAVEHHLTQADEDLLKAARKRTAATNVAAIIAGDQLRTTRERFQAEIESVRDDEEIARARAQLAQTTKDRRDSALLLLDLSQKQERLALQEVIETSKNVDDIKRARARLGHLDELRDLQAKVIGQEHEGPMAAYRRRLDNGLSDIHSRLEDIEVQGLQGLEDDAARATVKVLGLKGALATVAEELERIALEKGLQFLLGLIGGGGGISKSSGSFGLGEIKTFAAGGDPPLGRVSVVGERGPELFVPKTPGTIIPNHMLRGRSGGGRDVIEVHVFGTEDFDARVERKTVRTVGAMAPAIAGMALSRVMKLGRAGING